MPIIEITVDNIADFISTNAMVLIDFWAEWCGPCRAFAPVFDQAAQDNEDIAFGKCDVSSQPHLASALHVVSIPTLMAFKHGVHVGMQTGMLPKPALDDLISSLRELQDPEAAVARKDE
jgi:thioredoxin 1